MPSSGSSSGAAKLGRMPLRTRPSITEEWTLRWTTTRSPECASARQIVWLPCEAPLIRNQVRRAPQAAGGELLRLLERGRLGADVDPLGDRGDVVAQADLADQLAHRRVGARAALVAGDLEAAGVAGRVGEQRVDVGSRVLALARHRFESTPARRALRGHLGAMKHTPHGYWLEEAGTVEPAAAAERRARRRRRRRRRRLHRDVGRLAREGARARGAGRPARGGRALRARAERPQRRLLQRDVALAAEHARALGRRGGAGGRPRRRGRGRRDRRVLRGGGGRRLVPARPATSRSRPPRPTTTRPVEAVAACRELGEADAAQELDRRARSPSAAPRRPSAAASSSPTRRRCSRRASRSACASGCVARGVEIFESSPMRA